MQIQVVVEPTAGNGFVARTGWPFDAVGYGNSADEAIRLLQDGIERRIAAGLKIITIEVPDPESTRPHN